MDENICRFIPSHGSNDSVSIINYVLETKPQIYTGLKSNSIYRMHLVADGEGIFHIPGKTMHLQKGDLFFCFPAVSYAIESDEDFRYFYISYLGGRANAIMEQLHIQSSACLFHDFESLIDMWREGLSVNQGVSGLRSESLLLYTLSVLGDRLLYKESKENGSNDTALIIKKYIDENFSDIDLSLQKIGQICSYNPAYISSLFKNTFKIGFSEYLNTVRIQHAYMLIEQGFTSIQNIAMLCGYRDPMYFSKIFRANFGISPRTYMANRATSKGQSTSNK